MHINEITNKKEWNAFMDMNESSSFLHTWEWGEFQKMQGNEILRLGTFQNDTLISVVLIEKIKAKRGSFLFIPHGPLINLKSHFFHQGKQNSNLKLIFSNLRDYLIKYAKKEGFSFIRIAPDLIDNPENHTLFHDLGFKKAPIYMHAERMWILDLDKPESELLQSMRKTTRYLINRADRDGITIEKRTDANAIEDFWKIYKETARREHFVPFSKEFIKHEFEAFHKDNNALFLFGKAGNEYLASALILYTKHSGFYHQGASIHTKFPVPYRLQWEAILETKKRGCKSYNFWGILQEGRTPKNWGGLTMFKTGFGGRQLDYLSTQDFILNPKYYLTYGYELYLRMKRGV